MAHPCIICGKPTYRKYKYCYKCNKAGIKSPLLKRKNIIFPKQDEYDILLVKERMLGLSDSDITKIENYEKKYKTEIEQIYGKGFVDQRTRQREFKKRFFIRTRIY